MFVLIFLIPAFGFLWHRLLRSLPRKAGHSCTYSNSIEQNSKPLFFCSVKEVFSSKRCVHHSVQRCCKILLQKNASAKHMRSYKNHLCKSLTK